MIFVIAEIMRYGIYNKTEMIRDLSQLYAEQVMKMKESDRKKIYAHIAGLVENVSFVSANAFLPFIAEDSARGIVSTAVIDYVGLAPLTKNDPMSRPRDIIGLIESGNLKNEGAAFGALLYLGDARVCKMLWLIRDHLDRKGINEAVKCSMFWHTAAMFSL